MKTRLWPLIVALVATSSWWTGGASLRQQDRLGETPVVRLEVRPTLRCEHAVVVPRRRLTHLL